MNGPTRQVRRMIILEDKGQKENAHIAKNKYWQEEGVEVLRVPLPVGDYVLGTNKTMDVIFRKDKRGIDVKKMDFLGTYSIAVDTKKDIQELVGDICGGQHSRFRDECILAQNNGIKLYILIENVGSLIKGTRDVYNRTITKLEDLHLWINPRLFIMKNSNEIGGYYKNGRPKYKKVQKYPNATRGERLQKACYTMQEKYGCEFVFCHPSDAGARVLELLGAEV